MSNSLIFDIAYVSVGLFVLISSIKNWDVFFESFTAKFTVDLFGRNIARIFYGVSSTVFLCIVLFSFEYEELTLLVIEKIKNNN